MLDARVTVAKARRDDGHGRAIWRGVGRGGRGDRRRGWMKHSCKGHAAARGIERARATGTYACPTFDPRTAADGVLEEVP